MCALEQQSHFLWRMSLTSPTDPRTGSMSMRTDVNALTNKPCRGMQGQRVAFTCLYHIAGKKCDYFVVYI